jgi:hypothetical protein
MTPKEKAEYLISRFLSISVSHYDDIIDGIRDGIRITLAKKSALIAVDEMLGNAAMIWGGRNTDTGLTARDEFRKYWNEVKQELESL